MRGICLNGRVMRNVRCTCCWMQMPRSKTPPPAGTPPIACADCAKAGCEVKYAGYWKRGENCPRKTRMSKAGRAAAAAARWQRYKDEDKAKAKP